MTLMSNFKLNSDVVWAFVKMSALKISIALCINVGYAGFQGELGIDVAEKLGFISYRVRYLL